ncbi:MAG: AMP-binding protein [Deltaproteobacteria bacterium]|nr:MAG: AMP-binding protein [Deltaproteobacteria bacterium]
MTQEEFPTHRKEDAARYSKFRWWLGMTLGDMFDKATDLYPNKEAIIDDTGRLSYAQVREKADKLAVSLMELGIQPQQRVLMQLPNWSEFVYTYFALQKIGAIVVLLLPRHAQLEINHLCQLTGAVAWIVPEKYRKINYLPIIKDVGKANPDLKHIILVRSEGAPGLKTLESMIRDADLTDERRAELLERRPEPTLVAHLGPTGGTTGLPKVAPRTHNVLICNVEYKVRGWELTNRDICVAVTPVGHDMTFTIAICGSIFSFGTLVLLDSTEPEDFCEIVQVERATCAVMAPALAIRVVNFPGLKDYDVSSLLKVHVGGAPSTPELIRSVDEKLDCIFVNGLGSTEGLNIMTRLDYDLDTICSTSGRPCCPYSEYRIVDKDGREVPRNTDGELMAKGPDVFAGYFKAPEENKKSFTRDGFFKTGDLARMDEFGNIRLTGRIKDVINRGGENINSADIEKLIIEHPDVEDVAVVGMPDKELGERICAYVQPTSSAELSFEGIVSFLKNRGASVLQLPERIEFIDRIPLTKAAKADKAALREDIAKKLAEE